MDVLSTVAPVKTVFADAVDDIGAGAMPKSSLVLYGRVLCFHLFFLNRVLLVERAVLNALNLDSQMFIALT